MTVTFDPFSARDDATKEWSGRAESTGDAMVKTMESARDWAEEAVTVWPDDARREQDDAETLRSDIECLASRIQSDAIAAERARCARVVRGVGDSQTDDDRVLTETITVFIESGQEPPTGAPVGTAVPVPGPDACAPLEELSKFSIEFKRIISTKVSAEITLGQIAAYLDRTGWTLTYLVDTADEWGQTFKLARWARGNDSITFRDDDDDSCISYKVRLMAMVEGRQPGDVLRDIATEPT